MPWVRRSDSAAMSPMVLAPMEWDEDDGLTPTLRINTIAGFVQRCVDMAALYETDYVVDKSTLMLCGGPEWEWLTAHAERAGYWSKLDDRRWLIVDDPDNFVHIRLKAEVEWERQRKRDNSNPDLIVPVRLRDGDACRYCGVIVNWRARKGGRAGTYHHRRRPALGPDDLAVCCQSCNSSLGLPTGAEKKQIWAPPKNPFYGAETVALLAKHGIDVEVSATRPRIQRDTAPRDPASGGTPRQDGQPARDPASGGTTRTATPAEPLGHRAASSAIPQPAGHRSRDPQPRTPRPHRAQQSKQDSGHDPPAPSGRNLPDPAERGSPKSGNAGSGRVRDGTAAPPHQDHVNADSRARRRRGRRANPKPRREGQP